MHIGALEARVFILNTLLNRPTPEDQSVFMMTTIPTVLFIIACDCALYLLLTQSGLACRPLLASRCLFMKLKVIEYFPLT